MISESELRIMISLDEEYGKITSSRLSRKLGITLGKALELITEYEAFKDHNHDDAIKEEENDDKKPVSYIFASENDVVSPQSNTFWINYEIKVEVKSVYGNERFYPKCNLSKTICQMMDRATLSKEQLKIWQNAGFKFDVKVPEYTLD